MFNSKGVREKGSFILQRTCWTQYDLVGKSNSYCIADLYSKINIDSTSIVVQSVTPTSDSEQVEVITKLETAQVIAPHEECTELLRVVIAQWAYKPKKENRLAYDYLILVSVEDIQENYISHAKFDTFIDKNYIRYDYTDPDKTYCVVDYSMFYGANFNLETSYAKLNGDQMVYEETVFFMILNSTMQMIGFEKVNIDDKLDEMDYGYDKLTGSADIDVTDFIESSLQARMLCYGCNLYFEDDFGNGKGFYSKLCWDEACNRPVRSFRLKIGDIVYLKYASLSRLTVAYLNNPIIKYCE